MKNWNFICPLGRLGIAFLVLTCSGCANRLFYHPTSRVYTTPAEFQLDYEEVSFESLDGTQLQGWFMPAVGEPKGTVIHFHGNAQNMTSHFLFVNWLPAEGFNLFVFDYRGYGQSHGALKRKGIYQDVVAAIKYVHGRPDVEPDNLLLLGQSLGGVLAIAAAGREDLPGIRAVVADSPFYSFRLIVRDKIKLIPVLSWFRWPLSYVVVSNRYSPAPVVDRISPVPILIMHGTADRVIPFEHGKMLFESAKEPKQFWEIEGGRHTEALIRDDWPYREQLVAFFLQSLKKTMNGE